MSTSTVQSAVKMLPKYLNCDTTSSATPHSMHPDSAANSSTFAGNLVILLDHNQHCSPVCDHCKTLAQKDGIHGRHSCLELLSVITYTPQLKAEQNELSASNAALTPCMLASCSSDSAEEAGNPHSDAEAYSSPSEASAGSMCLRLLRCRKEINEKTMLLGNHIAEDVQGGSSDIGDVGTRKSSDSQAEQSQFDYCSSWNARCSQYCSPDLTCFHLY